MTTLFDPLDAGDLPIVPQLIPAHTRAAIGTIFAATDPGAHQPSGWWVEQASDNVRTLVPRRADRLSVDEHRPDDPDRPYLRLFGPIADQRLRTDDQDATVRTATYESMAAFMRENNMLQDAYVFNFQR